MFNSEVKYSYKDICIVPTVESDIKSRLECNPFKDNYLPIFTSPMDTVVDFNTSIKYIKNHIIPIIPRTESIDLRTQLLYSGLYWVAFSFNEFNSFFKDPIAIEDEKTYHILIDMANGNMKHVLKQISLIKALYNDKIQIMTGNIANPKSYSILSDCGVDYIRLSIGTGGGCTTTTNTGIHYPIASLIYETWKESLKKSGPKIIADGGTKSYSDIIKALSLGADYIMVGSIFAGLEDTPGKIIIENNIKYKEFYGMSSEKGHTALGHQKKNGGYEGLSKRIPINNTIDNWSSNMESYLRSAMSYCGIRDIKDFNPYNVETTLMSEFTIKSINN